MEGKSIIHYLPSLRLCIRPTAQTLKRSKRAAPRKGTTRPDGAVKTPDTQTSITERLPWCPTKQKAMRKWSYRHCIKDC